MLAALDVHYHDPSATAAAVLFAHWHDAAPASEHSALCQNIQPYVPGQFFRRELPCLLAVLATIHDPIELIIVDSYVQLAAHPGMGQHLFEALGSKTPVIGVAKTPFAGAPAAEVFRGTSKTALYVTAIGLDLAIAAAHVQTMHGPHRLPTLLKRVDQLSRV